MHTNVKRQQRVHLLAVSVGGLGGSAAMQLKKKARLHAIEGLTIVAIDTDVNDAESYKQHGVNTIHLDPGGTFANVGGNRTEAILREPAAFDSKDRFFQEFVALKCSNSLDDMGIGYGAGTNPGFGEFIFRACMPVLTRGLSDYLDDCLAHADKVQPFIFGSGGGGTSAPGILLMSTLLGTHQGLVRCSLQDVARVCKPFVVTAPPLIQSKMAANRTMSLRPPANAYAFQHELNLLAKKKCVEFAFKLNTQNGRGVAVETLEGAADLLADAIVGLAISYPSMASSFCDTAKVVRHEDRFGIRLRKPK